MAWYAGIDVGATNVRAAVGTREGTVVSTQRSTPPTSGIDITETVLSAVGAACEDAGIDPGEVIAAGIGSIGPLDTAEGVVHGPANLPDDVGTIPLTGPVGNLVDAPVYLHNDANAGAIGERFYAESNPDDMVYLTISSGIGAGVVVDGVVLGGWDGNAGEVGHIPLEDGGLRCGCGRRGHWEAYCSGNNIPRYAEHLHEGQETALPIGREFGAAEVFALADEDDFAAEVIERVAERNARGVTTLVHAYAPIVVYVGGAVALGNPGIVDGLRERVPGMVVTNVPDIRLTNLGEDAVVKGALASAMTRGTGDRRYLGESG